MILFANATCISLNHIPLGGGSRQNGEREVSPDLVAYGLSLALIRWQLQRPAPHDPSRSGRHRLWQNPPTRCQASTSCLAGVLRNITGPCMAAREQCSAGMRIAFEPLCRNPSRLVQNPSCSSSQQQRFLEAQHVSTIEADNVNDEIRRNTCLQRRAGEPGTAPP